MTPRADASASPAAPRQAEAPASRGDGPLPANRPTNAGGQPPAGREARPPRRIIVVGSPNVGKSALFNRLTGRYVAVSNYPGTTVEVARGRSRLFGPGAEVLDTPGMYSLMPVTEEERVARDMLFEERPKAVLHVVDAKNVGRMLGLTLQLAEAGLPVILVLNMMDEAAELGIRIDAERLEADLGVPVVTTVATKGRGLARLGERVHHLDGKAPRGLLRFDGPLENAIAAIASRLANEPHMSPRARAMLLLQDDAHERARLLAEGGDELAAEVRRIAGEAASQMGHSLHCQLAMAIKDASDRLLAGAAVFPAPRRRGAGEAVSRLMMNPWTGLPLLALVLYFGLYQFVGVLGAGTMVDYLQNGLFGRYVTPFFDSLAGRLLPWQVARELFVGDYGLITLGVRYAVAIILPIVTTFFLAFSVIEDSGYLPRLAMLIDRLFKRIGLNGRAVIPMVLGFGCNTMATMVTRTLETKRERVIATLLLALAVPCTAQMGIILAMLSARPAALALWACEVAGVFLLTGLLAAKVMPGERPSFYMELPPLRLPRLGNVLVKTYARLVWYFKEVLPLFLIASVLIWVGRRDFGGLLPDGGLFGLALRGLAPVVGALGLPKQAAFAFLFGFFRRDYGAAGLKDLYDAGKLAGNQLVVAAVTLTLFLPCVAQFLVMKKERGLKATLLVAGFVTALAMGAGWLTNFLLNMIGVQL
jgi:ferrous iron transport protein B